MSSSIYIFYNLYKYTAYSFNVYRRFFFYINIDSLYLSDSIIWVPDSPNPSIICHPNHRLHNDSRHHISRFICCLCIFRWFCIQHEIRQTKPTCVIIQWSLSLATRKIRHHKCTPYSTVFLGVLFEVQCNYMLIFCLILHKLIGICCYLDIRDLYTFTTIFLNVFLKQNLTICLFLGLFSTK